MTAKYPKGNEIIDGKEKSDLVVVRPSGMKTSGYVRHPCGQPCNSFIPKRLEDEAANETIVGAVILVTSKISKARLRDVLVRDYGSHVPQSIENEASGT